MSDYMFMLDCRLSAEQKRVLDQVQSAADAAGVSVFLAGGAMRDLLGGFPMRDLDFSVEGNALKLVKALEQSAGARTVSIDENRRSAELVFPGEVTAQIAMARKERYPKAGSKPQVTPAPIQEDLRGRDFTVNAMAVSLNRASRGLLLDPTNGLADLEAREMRATYPYAFYDDPSRLLRLVRLRVRMGFAVEERTKMQYDNARTAQVEEMIPPQAIAEELRKIALEPNPSEVLAALEGEGLLALFSATLTGTKLNLPAISRMEKVHQYVESAGLPVNGKLEHFLFLLTAKLTPKEKGALLKPLELTKAELDRMKGLEARAQKLEDALKASGLRKPSQVYQALADVPGDLMAFVLCHSSHKSATERIRAYLEKYLPAMREVTDEEWAAVEGQASTPKYQKNRQAFIAARLDVKPKAAEEELEVPVQAQVETAARGRRG